MGQKLSGHAREESSLRDQGARKFCRYALENFIGIEKTVIFERYNFDTDYV